MCSTDGGSEPWQALQSAASVLSAEDVTSWSDEQVRDGLRAMLSVVNQLDAVVSSAAASFDTRRLAEQDGFRAARSWLIAFGRMSQRAATGWLSRGRLLRQLPGLSAAAQTGAVSAEQIRTVGDLVGHVGIEAVQPFDEILAGVAATTGPGEVAQACHRIRAHVDPDGPDPDPHAADRRALSISRYGSLFSVSGRLDAEGGAIVMTALDALSAHPHPTTPAPRCGGAPMPWSNLPGRHWKAAPCPPQVVCDPNSACSSPPKPCLGSEAPPHPPIRPHPPMRLGRQRFTGNPRAGQPDALECAGVPMEPELAWSTWADRLPDSVAQRLACDCEVWRVILDPGVRAAAGGGTGTSDRATVDTQGAACPRPRLPVARLHRPFRLDRGASPTGLVPRRTVQYRQLFAAVPSTSRIGPRRTPGDGAGGSS